MRFYLKFFMEAGYIALICVFGLLFMFLAVLIAQAVVVKSHRETKNLPRKNVDEAKQHEYAEELSKLIKCKTIYSDNYDDTEFAKFRAEIKNMFPYVFKMAEFKLFGSGCIILKIEGEEKTRNVMFMSHHDVVEASGEWKHAPFGGEIVDGAVWGRGTVDTKTPLYGELKALDELLFEGYKFKTNVYIGSSNNEEICGDGIPLAVEYFKKNGVHFELVSDEGGAIVSGMMPTVKEKSAMIAVHEKGRHTVKCVAKSVGGHIGLNPSKANPTRRMANFITDATNPKNGIFKQTFSKEVEATFRAHAPYMAFPMRLLFASFDLFKPILLKVMPKVSSQVGAMLGTNLYFTTIHGGEREQVQPKEVEAYAFFRCVRDSELQKEKVKFAKLAEKYDIELTDSVVDYCAPTPFESDYFALFKQVLNDNFPDVVVSPFLLTAGSDARWFGEIADNILRFAPLDLNKQQYASIHNANENIDVKNIGEVVLFYKTIMSKIA
ncbi:MAG: M20/M25/M40 family metallo-hydrolase [Clostridia bacterium]